MPQKIIDLWKKEIFVWYDIFRDERLINPLSRTIKNPKSTFYAKITFFGLYLGNRFGDNSVLFPDRHTNAMKSYKMLALRREFYFTVWDFYSEQRDLLLLSSLQNLKPQKFWSKWTLLTALILLLICGYLTSILPVLKRCRWVE